MQSVFTNALSRMLAKHLSLSATRQETLCWLVLLMLRFGSVTLWRLAAHVETVARTDSVRRRFYRFFQKVDVDSGIGARMVVSLLGLAGKPWVLAIDRTNWDFGRTTINILMISVEWRGIAVPLIFTLLPKSGNSNTTERTDLLSRLKAVFPDMKIAQLTGDREFIGSAWMTYLARQNIPFTLRLRENQYVGRDGYATWRLSRYAQGLKRGDKRILKGFWRLGTRDLDVRIVMMRLKTGELLILATNGGPARALARYRRRWTIETLFGNLKTRGFDLEATHITAPRKLETLLVLMSLATALAAKTGHAAHRARPVSVKNHGRKAISFFALGLTSLRKIPARKTCDQIIGFLASLCSPKIPPNTLIRLGF